MDMQSTWLQVEHPGAPNFPALLLRPSACTGPLPGVIVIQEAFGLDHHIQDVARRVAEAGYTVLAPDLYAVDGQRPAPLAAPRTEQVKNFLDALPPTAWGDLQLRQQALEKYPVAERREIEESLGLVLNPNRPWDAWTAALQRCVQWLRESPLCRGRRVGAVGFCMGGALVGRLACSEPDLAAGVMFYGMAPPAERIAAISCPLLALHGADDTRLVSALPDFVKAMQAAGKSLEVHVYPAAPHAFFNDTRRSYRSEAARDAWARTASFFAQHLAAT